jgi:ATP-binding cassette subfamily F protein uup
VNFLQVDKLSKSFGERVLFKDINFGLQEGQKTALIAKNGAGKSTLMRILVGREQPDSGEVVFRNDCVVSFLEQDPPFNPEHTIEEAVFAWDDPRIKAVQEYEHILLSEPSAERDLQLEEANRKMDELKAWDIEARAKEVLGKLQLHDLSRKMAELSGGQRKRVALAAMLIREPDLMLLDEPTQGMGHEDVERVTQLIKKVSAGRTILMVEHNMNVIASIADKITVLQRGAVLAEGSYNEVSKNPLVMEAYMGTADGVLAGAHA